MNFTTLYANKNVYAVSDTLTSEAIVNLASEVFFQQR